MNDDLYPNDGTYFAEPVEQNVARKKEKANTLEALPILKEIITHLEERISFYGSVDAMPTSVKTNPTKFMNMHNAHELVKKSLVNEKEYIESLLDAHAPNL